MASDWEGVSFGFSHTLFEPAPSWTRMDTGTNVDEITVERGRSDEFERTGTGTAAIHFNDTDGDVDPTLGVDLDARPASIAIRNPVTDEWFPLYRGQVDEVSGDLDKSQRVTRTTVSLVDALDYLAGVQLMPGVFGDTPPAASAGYVFYEDTVSDGFQTRIVQALTDSQWPSALSSVFTGNINMPESVYSPGESLLTVIDDAADAEFPTVANRYVDAEGFFCAHGRLARFDPDTVSASATHWDFQRWKVGDNDAADADPERARINPPFQWVRSRKMVRNSAIAYPQSAEGTDMDGLVVDDATSIARYGYRAWSAENLLLSEGTTTGNNAVDEARLYATYIVENYKELRNRLGRITVKPLPPGHPRAEAVWELLTGVDISDIVNVSIGHPGGGGFSEDFYVEGISYTIRPAVKDLDTGYPYIELGLDLSPAAYWETNPFA